MTKKIICNQGVKGYRALAFFLASAATVITVFSQFSEHDLLMVYGPLWLAVAFFSLNKGGSVARIGQFGTLFFLGYIAFGLICMLFFFQTGVLGYMSNLFLCFTKIVLMYFVGMALSSLLLSVKQLRCLAYIYILSSVIYAVWVQVNYMPSFQSWLSSELYLFGQKNSFGQIAGVAVVLAVLLPKHSVKERIFAFASALYLFSMIAGVQCRSAMIACIASLTVWLLLKKKYKVLGFGLFVCMIVLMAVPQIQPIVRHIFFLDKYSDASLNSMSSGRLDLWDDALHMINANAMQGVGDYYVDNFYLNVIANVGLVAGCLLIALIIIRLVYNFGLVMRLEQAREGFNSIHYRVFAMLCGVLAVFYLVESAFEALPPIGPGACSFLFWIACGYVDEMRALGSGTYESPINTRGNK